MFENVKFCGTFRSYQQKILDGADKYLSDGRINVVAAPGSGKTVLGLELICRLGKPCIILSPTTTIRDQWGQRFSESFLPCGEDISSFVSYDLRKRACLTSITYQALYSAVEKVKCSDGEEVDYSDIDIFEAVMGAGVETVCLDEAHHLQNEWQRALETFLKKLGGRVKIISLTATPPYDASPGEWKRYTDICGEIDEEIFVPELVKQGTLCPHQDYIYFSYPTGEETAELKSYRKNAAEALEEAKKSGLFYKLSAALNAKYADERFLFSNVNEITAALGLLGQYGAEPDERFSNVFPYRKRSGKPDIKTVETAVNFLLSSGVAGEELAENFRNVFASRKLIVRGKVCLDLNEKLKRVLVSSSGKLGGIAEIAKCESESLGEGLRLLVLTDYIRKENISLIGTGQKPDGVSVVSAFETVRRTVNLPVGALSGNLVILPLDCEPVLKERGAKFTVKPLKAEGYGEFVFTGGNREKVGCVGALFESGKINILVGTKSLLGEGWDSPCINALILASFVGSFMLSNQMRGRAIRVDKNNPQKTANIWHLVAAEPRHALEESKAGAAVTKLLQDDGELISCDYETLKRRFNCFVAPAYDTGVIESGIERVSIIKPPYDEKGIADINAQMRERAADREKLKEVWQTAVSGTGRISEATDVPAQKKLPLFNFRNVGLALLLLSLAVGLSALVIIACVMPYGGEYNIPLIAAGCVAAVVLYVFGVRLGYRVLEHKNPKRSVKKLVQAVLDTLKELYLIDGGRLSVKVYGAGTDISVSLSDANERDGKLFQNAVAELFSAIDNPRYVLIPKSFFGKYNYFCALACPSVFGSKKEYAGQFVRNLKKTLGRLELVYTRGDGGQKLLLKCRCFSYINFNDATIKKVQRI